MGLYLPELTDSDAGPTLQRFEINDLNSSPRHLNEPSVFQRLERSLDHLANRADHRSELILRVFGTRVGNSSLSVCAPRARSTSSLATRATTYGAKYPQPPVCRHEGARQRGG